MLDPKKEHAVVGENNPWLSGFTIPQPPSPSPSSAPAAVRVPPPTGPVGPQRGVPVPDQVDQLRTLDYAEAAELWCVGVHGGSGESSLAALVPGWREAGHGWPRTPDAAPSRVVLVARSNVRGLHAAQKAAMQWAAGLVPTVRCVGLVIVADAPGRLPRALRDLARVVGGGVPRTWTIPWVEGWRLGEPPTLDNSPAEVRRLVHDVRAILNPGAETTNKR
ncbi:MAG: DUF6668 family protein [Rhodoglobus sp.]